VNLLMAVAVDVVVDKDVDNQVGSGLVARRLN
jgi:hypothetical protein